MPDRIRYAPSRPALVNADEAAARRERDRFYGSTRWRELRARHLAKHPLCASCRRRGETTAATIVHHVKERLAFPALAFTPSNLESACASCHTREHKRK